MKIKLVRKNRLRKKLEAWCAGKNTPKIAKEFPYIWTRNQSWKKFPPAVALRNGKIVGFYATTHTKTGYCNLYYVAVDDRYKGRGFGSRLIEHALQQAQLKGLRRWTNKSHIGSDGENYFSKHLGIPPIGKQGDQVVYDWCMLGVLSTETIREQAEHPRDFLRLNEIPPQKIAQYKRFGLQPLIRIPGLSEPGEGLKPGEQAIRRFPRIGRFPRFPRSLHRIVNIRGTNGSGKSHIIHQIIKKFGVKRLVDTGKIDKLGKIWGYRILGMKRPTYILGRYESQCGGCDVFQTRPDKKCMEMVQDGLRELSKRGDVLFEGIIVSGVAGRWIPMSKELSERAHFIFGVLDTPLQKCLDRIQRRKDKRGDKRPWSPYNTTQKWYSSHSCGRLLARNYMDVRVLPHDNGLETVLQWLER